MKHDDDSTEGAAAGLAVPLMKRRRFIRALAVSAGLGAGVLASGVKLSADEVCTTYSCPTHNCNGTVTCISSYIGNCTSGKKNV